LVLLLLLLVAVVVPEFVLLELLDEELEVVDEDVVGTLLDGVEDPEVGAGFVSPPPEPLDAPPLLDGFVGEGNVTALGSIPRRGLPDCELWENIIVVIHLLQY
jgi:hypothetical protein